MKIQIVYDSYFGNTKKVAEVIEKAVRKGNRVRVESVQDATGDDADTDLLILGSPTRAFRPTERMKMFLQSLSVRGQKVAVFDTRMTTVDSRVLRFMVKVFGYAEDSMKKTLKKKGAVLVGSAGFSVKDTKGPLAKGEVDRIKQWAKGLL
ncbi:MAG: flavodoxin family protein [Nanoarchaeota archaeon]